MGKRKKRRSAMKKNRQGEWVINPDATTLLRDFCDALWSKAVIADYAGKCAICGRTENLNAHHLINRHHTGTRHMLENGFCLCGYCHTMCPNYSPHMNEEGWKSWLEENFPHVAKWEHMAWNTGLHKFDSVKTVFYYCDILNHLKQYFSDDEFAAVVGKRFSEYLEENQ